MRKSLTARHPFRESLSAVEGRRAGVGDLRSRVSDQLSVSLGGTALSLPPLLDCRAQDLEGEMPRRPLPPSAHFALACLSLKPEFRACGQLGALWWPFWAELWAVPLPTGSWRSWPSLAVTGLCVLLH